MDILSGVSVAQCANEVRIIIRAKSEIEAIELQSIIAYELRNGRLNIDITMDSPITVTEEVA